MDTTAREEVRRARRQQASQAVGGPSIGRLLLGGFVLIFALWLVSGFDLVRRLNDVEERQAALTTAFRRAERSLNAIQAQVLLGSVYLRDALLDLDRDSADDYHQRLEQSRADIEQALAQYRPVVQSETERASFRTLQAEVDDYWNSLLEPVLTWDATRKAVEARALLRRQVIPKRELIARISARIQELNREAFELQQAEVSQIFRQLHTRVWTTSGLTLLMSLVVAGAVTRYATILEDRIRQQMVRDLEHARDLQRLSAKLVDVQEQERRSIARELHDEVGQALTAIKVELAVAERTGGLSEKVQLALQDVRAITDRTLQQVRDLSQLLHPSLLDDLGLPAALEWYLKGFSRRTDVKAELLQDRMEQRLPPQVETCVFRVVQEALTNVARHASASSVRVYLQRLPHTVLLTVEDDGVGLAQEDEAEPKRGLGLLGIRERAGELGGTFRIESQPGKGTRLTVELPVEASQDEFSHADAHPAG